MGVALKDLIIRKEIKIEDLKGKVLVVDSYNVLYQFLTTIRQRDGSLLTDSKGNVTSHLAGLFTRTTNLMRRGLKLVFVLDGEVPELKKEERMRRKEVKKVAKKNYEIAKKRKDLAEMRKYAVRTTVLTDQMIEDAKELIAALGLPMVQAPSEGEAQAAYMVNKGDAYAAVSQDFDSLLFGAPRLVQNLTISARRKMPGVLSYRTVKPCIINLAENLNTLKIDQDHLIALGMLIGTDYNVGGIKGIGPKNALKLVKLFENDFDGLFKHVHWENFFDVRWQDVFYMFKRVPVEKKYKIKFQKVDVERILHLLCEKHDFGKERVFQILKKFKAEEDKKQKSLVDF